MTDLDEEERERLAATIAWLGNADPDDRHRAALDVNWGGPLYLIDWIVRQADCDMATALTVFWAAQPTCWIEEQGASTGARDGYSYLSRQLCVYIAERVRAGGFTRSSIAFDPDVGTKKDYVDLVAIENALMNPSFRTHPDLIRPRSGRQVENDAAFYRRYPEDLHQSCYFDGDALSDTPKSIALMEEVKRLQQATLRLLPSWLRH